MKKILLSLFLIGMINEVIAQHSVEGKLVDQHQRPAAGIAVTLVSAKDSAQQQGVTDSLGYFRFSRLHPGQFRISIRSLIWKPYESVFFTIDNTLKEYKVPVIALEPAAAKELSGVVIQARKSLLEFSPDKTTVNIDAMPGSAASNVLDILSRTPGVQVDNQGQINLNGQNGVQLLIDGKPTYLSAQDLATYLRSMPAASLEKIELIENPSARYDAAGNAIINLRLKKSKVAGFNGGFSAGYSQGRYDRHYYSLNLNYQYDRLRSYMNIGVGLDKNFSTDNFSRRFFTPVNELLSVVKLNNWQQNTGKGLNLNTGLDYQLTDRTQLGLTASFNTGKRNGLFTYESQTQNAQEQQTELGYGDTRNKDTRSNTGLGVNFLHNFARKGRELTADINYLRYEMDGRQQQSRYLQLINDEPEKEPGWLYQTPAGIRIYSAKADFVEPLSAKGRVEAGWKSSFVRNENNTNVLIGDNNPIYQPGLSNHFIYEEFIHAAYINAQQQWKRIGLMAGLRMEYTHSKGRQAGQSQGTATDFSRGYANWFPNFSISYKLDTTRVRVLTLLYLRRVNRPNYQQLNPFLFYRDNYSYTGGNPLLNPQFQNRIELKYQHGEQLWAGLSYNPFTGVIVPVTQVLQDTLITRPGNFRFGKMLLLNIGYNNRVTRWWSLNTTIRLSRIGLRGTIDGQRLQPNTNVLRWEFNNYFTLSNAITAELGSYLASADMNGQNATSAMFRMYAGVQKKIGEKLSVRLSAEDIFGSWVYHNRSIGLKQADYIQTSQSDTQRVGLSLSWRFGKKPQQQKREREAAAEEEKGRTN